MGLLVFMAGCAGTQADQQAPAASRTSAPPAEPRADAGSIAGRTVTDEFYPIPGVDVTLAGPNLGATSDASGAFTINDVPPGTYVLYSQRLGYESAGMRVSVRAEEVLNVTIMLKPMEIAPEPYTHTNHKTAFIQFGNAWVSYALFTANSTGLHGMMCPTCIFTVHYPPKPVAVMTEGYWQCSPCYPPLVNDDIWFLINVNVTSSSEGSVVINSYLSNREQFNWTARQVEFAKVAKGSWFRFRVEGGGGSIGSAGVSGVSYNQRVETYNSFAYVAEFAEGFSALPPRN